ncbi:MAG TPA: hypothetical protein PLR99_30860 [Polyangiaceae bacterium]|nr:hypothetical protein [Polyangiaceae bacterium]
MTIDPNPYAPPAAPIPDPPPDRGPRPLPRVEGDALVVHEESPLPRRCAKCGEKGDATPSLRVFQHVPWWAHALVGAFAALVFRRVARIHLPLCGACADRWMEHQRAFGSAVLAMGTVVVASFVGLVGADRDARGPLALFTTLAFVGALVGAIALRRARLDPFVVRARLVRDRAAWLIGLHPRFVARATRAPRARAAGGARARVAGEPLTPR